jgi:exopolysaccharide biosynthesis polyprenyl glycosylphosphotransferase
MLTGGLSAADEGHGEPSSARLDVLDVLLSDAEAHTPTRTIDASPTRFGPAHVTTDQRSPAVRTSAAVHESRPRWMRRYQRLLVGVDLAAASIAVAIAFLVRFGLPAGAVNLKTYTVLAVAIPVAWVGVVWLNRAYEGRFIGAGPAEFDRLLKAFLYLTALVAIGSYLTRAEIARGFVVLALPLALVIDVVGRYRARKYLHRRRSCGRAMTSMLLVGDGRSVADFAAMVRRDRHAGMNVIGACVPAELVDDAETRRQLADADVGLLGDVDSIVSAVAASHADTVAVVSTSTVGRDRVRWISWQLEGTDTDLVVSPGLTEVAGRRLHIQPVAGLPLLHVEEPEFTGFRRFLKSTFDRTVAMVVLILLAPVALGVALAVRVSSRGPVFFRQQRVGRNGHHFTMVKFRSMYLDAEQRKSELEQRNETADGLWFKIRNDPRITPVGRFIRKYSLDELPQLFNVLTGRMSLVGPRPNLPAEVAKYGDDMRRRLLVKPGITGLWQISGRNDLSWQETVQLDLRYVENWTLGYDLMILWKTPSAVARGLGAY